MTFKASHMAESGMDLECFIPLLPSALEREEMSIKVFFMVSLIPGTIFDT